MRGDRTLYVQAAYILVDDNTVEREYSPLEKIPDNYEKYVVTFDDIVYYAYSQMAESNASRSSFRCRSISALRRW